MKYHTIYAILDDNQNPFYVGKTYRLGIRKQEHVRAAKKGVRTHLYNKLRKLLSEAKEFCFIILETDITEEKVDEREQYYIAKLKADGFSLCNLTEGGDGTTGLKIPRSPEYCQKISERRIGRKHSAETRRKLSRAWKRTPEQLASVGLKLKEKNTGVINIKKYRLVDSDGTEYITENGLCDFCRKHGLSHPNLIKVINGQRKHHKGWTGTRL